MDTNRHKDSSSRSLSAPELILDPHSPEFIDACLAFIKQSAARNSHVAGDWPEESRREVGRRMAPYEQESGSANGSTTDDPTSLLQLVGRLEAHIVELREALAQAQAEIKQNSEARVATADPLTGPTLSDYEADLAALQEARRREGQVRVELETLRADSTNVRILYDQATAALEAASQRASQARAEYDAAIDVISDRNAAIEQLRRDIETRDRGIEDLQRRLLEAEEARIADAAAFIDSLDAYKS